MTSNELQKLVTDTLHFRRLNPDASSLQTNLAGKELERQPADAMPVIEQVLQNEVSPYFSGSDENPFHGLSNLLGAYMLIGSRHDVCRSVEFLRTLPPTLKAHAVALVPVFFRKKSKFRPQEKETNEQKRFPDERLLSFVMESTQSANPTVQDNAKWVMSFYDL